MKSQIMLKLHRMQNRDRDKNEQIKIIDHFAELSTSITLDIFI